MSFQPADSGLQPDPHPEEASPRKKPGPRPGTRHAGMFKPGYDERRMAPRVKRDFQALVKDHAEEAAEVLLECIRDEGAPWKERRASAELLIAHAVGTPVSRVLHAQTNGLPAGGLEAASPQQLLQWVQGIHNEKEAENALETTYEEIRYEETQEETGS